MVLVEVKASFLNYESTKDGDIWTIMNEGEYTLETPTWSKKEVNRLHIDVQKLESPTTLDWTPWDSDLKKVVEAWGNESKSWIGKKIRITHDGKKMIISPVTTEVKPHVRTD